MFNLIKRQPEVRCTFRQPVSQSNRFRHFASVGSCPGGSLMLSINLPVGSNWGYTPGNTSMYVCVSVVVVL